MIFSRGTLLRRSRLAELQLYWFIAFQKINQFIVYAIRISSHNPSL